MVMGQYQVGVVAIASADRLCGIFSERDLLRRVIARGKVPDSTELREVMTPNPITASREEDRQSAMRKMQRVGCRHLPIVAHGRVVDMLSMRDILAVELEERVQEIKALRGYIHGTY